MQDSWTEPLPLMDRTMCDRISNKTEEYLSLIKWRNDGAPRDLQHAVELAKKGIDGGKDATLRLKPTSRRFNEWMDWNNLVTFLFNRDTEYQTLLSAIRNAIYETIHVTYFIYYISHNSR